MTYGTRKVVVGVDGSPASLRALWCAVEEARHRDWPLQIVYVSEEIGSPAIRASAGMVGYACLVPADTDRGMRIAYDAVVELFGGRLADVSITVTIASPPIGRALVSAVESTDLLVVGRSRRGLIHRFWMGSVSGYCVAHSPCPVLAVPEPEAPRRSYSIRHHRKSARRAASDH